MGQSERTETEASGTKKAAHVSARLRPVCSYVLVRTGDETGEGSVEGSKVAPEAESGG